MKIGFIGLGNMGSGMAANLLKAGHQVIAYNRSQAKVDALAARGAVAARSVAEASSADIVFTMLANDDAVEAVTFGDDGVLASLKSGGIHVGGAEEFAVESVGPAVVRTLDARGEFSV